MDSKFEKKILEKRVLRATLLRRTKEYLQHFPIKQIFSLVLFNAVVPDYHFSDGFDQNAT